jgi:hypothetical protein
VAAEGNVGTIFAAGGSEEGGAVVGVVVSEEPTLSYDGGEGAVGLGGGGFDVLGEGVI